MNERPRTYSIDELEQESGFDRRTIAYYVQMGLLPKIGRRGPRTRYPQLFLDRLRFIKRIRELQDQGRAGTVTLAEIRVLLDEMSQQELAEAAAGRVPPDDVVSEKLPPEVMGMPERLFASAGYPSVSAASDRGAPAIESATRRAERMLAREVSPPLPAAMEPGDMAAAGFDDELMYSLAQPLAVGQGPPRAEEVGAALDELKQAAGLCPSGPDSTSEQWTRANVTPDITISARDLDEDGVDLLERVAHLLRRLMRGR